MQNSLWNWLRQFQVSGDTFWINQYTSHVPGLHQQDFGKEA